MTQLRPGKYLQHPYAVESAWTLRNPLLKNGEVGYAIVLVNGITHIRKKVGPGYWNDLEYYDGVVWTDTTPVTNPIGDASGNIAGLTPIEILDKQLNPYGVPIVSNLINNGGYDTQYLADKVVEIGNNVTDPVTIQYSVSNQANLIAGLPITVTAGGRFTNEGSFALGNINLTHTGLNPSALDAITISVQAIHNQGASAIATTTLKFNPKIISAVAQVHPVDGVAVMALPNKQYLITRDYKNTYSAPVAGYPVLCIPTMLAPSSVIFTDVTNGVVDGYAMDDLGIMSINNGVGTYNYQVYAGTYYLLNSTNYTVS